MVPTPRNPPSPSQHVSRFGFIFPSTMATEDPQQFSEDAEKRISTKEGELKITRVKKQSVPAGQKVLRSLKPSSTQATQRKTTQNPNTISNPSRNAQQMANNAQQSNNPNGTPAFDIPDELVRRTLLKNDIRSTTPPIFAPKSKFQQEETESLIALDEAYAKFPQHSTNDRIVLNFKMIGPTLRHVSQKLIPRKLRTTIRTLCLSQNAIESLQGIAFFQQLESLSLAHNKIASMLEFRHIPETTRRRMKHIVLRGNPVTQHPDFRHEILRIFPNLETLDQEKITLEEKEIAITLSSKLTFLYLKLLYILEEYHTNLSRDNTNLQLKLELYRRAYGTHQAFCRYDIPYEVEARIARRYKEGRRLIISESGTNWAFYEQILKNDTVNQPTGETLLQEWIGINISGERRNIPPPTMHTKPNLGFNVSIEIENAIIDLFQFINAMIHPGQVEKITEAYKSEEISEGERQFGTRLMLLVLHLYESQFSKASDVEHVKSLREEIDTLAKNGEYYPFQIFSSNANFLKILKLLLTKKMNMVHDVSSMRQKVLETNFFALSIPGLIGAPTRTKKLSYLEEQSHPWKNVNNGITPMEEAEIRRQQRVRESMNALHSILDALKSNRPQGSARPDTHDQKSQDLKDTESSRLRERASHIQSVIANHRRRLNSVQQATHSDSENISSDEYDAEEVDESSIAFDGQVLPQNQSLSQRADVSKARVFENHPTQTTKQTNQGVHIIKRFDDANDVGNENSSGQCYSADITRTYEQESWEREVRAREKMIDEQLNQLAQQHYEYTILRKMFSALQEETKRQAMLRTIFHLWYQWAHRRQNYRKAVRKIRSVKKWMRLQLAFQEWHDNTCKAKKLHDLERKEQLLQLFEQRLRAQQQKIDHSKSDLIGRPQSAPRRINQSSQNPTYFVSTNDERYLHSKDDYYSKPKESKQAPWKPPSKSPSIPKLPSKLPPPVYTCFCAVKPDHHHITNPTPVFADSSLLQSKSGKRRRHAEERERQIGGTPHCRCAEMATAAPPRAHSPILHAPSRSKTPKKLKKHTQQQPKSKKHSINTKLLRLELARSLQENIRNQKYILETLKTSLPK